MNENSVYISLAAIVGGITLSAIVLVGVFSPDNMSTAAWVAGSLSAMGICLGFFASKKN
ncbi:hypothetical protein G0Q06_05765 [Puniceicoccales bacterium CK1056]|uniref:Uncharacterized protein n=1 Tax=Oceanipulchritudo coccoides TaxID=2706888 RepID=A0A6B2LZ15_9BACT|nr:hypothetical protein [Oceanipulchritudo coccoides]NDV61951.1 hypothetical protein [Oceanipulchritudo coccoides]